MSITLPRYSCVGNTFLLWDGGKRKLDPKSQIRFAQLWCNGFQGFWNDGFVYFETIGQDHYRWDFFNADGSKAEMCGNAARALIAHLYADAEVRVDSEFVSFVGSLTEEGVAVSWKLPHSKIPVEIEIDGHPERQFWSINTGVPHLLIEGEPDRELAQELRKHKLFGAAGTNVTFFVEVDSNAWQAVTYERGVEDFTLGCGTGAIAVAQFARLATGTREPQIIEMPGGELVVEELAENAIRLTGLAEKDFSIIFDEDLEEDK